MDLKRQLLLHLTRRHFFGLAARGIGVAALASLLPPARLLGGIPPSHSKLAGLPGLPHFPPKAKRVIFLFQQGAPSQIELFDYKPTLKALHGTQLPESVRRGPPLAGMDGNSRAEYTVAAPMFTFRQVGQSGTWISELLPHTAKIVDDITLIRSVQTEAANHDPVLTGRQE